MSETTWVLRGVDAETREKAAAEAERRGVTLADYLTDVVLQGLLTEQLQSPEFVAEEAETDAQDACSSALPQVNFVVRHRLEALERRVGLAVGGLDSAVHALDSSVFGLAARVDEAEALAANTADSLSLALQDLGANLAALRKRLADAEDQTGTLGEAQEAMGAAFAGRCVALEQHIAAVAEAANAANAAASELAAANEALKYAVADDFSAFARECASRLSAGLDEVRAAADVAAEQADIAVAHLVSELRTLRESIESRLQESAAETRLRVQTAFADAAEGINALAERVTENERLIVRSAEHLRAQLADVEDGAQTALEETAETLRQAGAGLAAEVARSAYDNRAALEGVHADLSTEIAELRDRQAAGHARLKLVDAAVASATTETAALREALEARIARSENTLRTALAQAQSSWDARLDALSVGLASSERTAAEAHYALRAETERVEACVFSSLEKLARDRVDGETALAHKLDETRQRLDGEFGDIRDQNSGVLARLRLLEAGAAPLDERLARIEAALAAGSEEIAARISRLESDSAGRAADRGVDERLLRLEAAAENDDTAHAMAALRGQIAAVAARLDAERADDSLGHALEDLRVRVSLQESQVNEAADRTHGVARMLGRIMAQGADAAKRAEERLSKLELDVANARANETTPAVDREVVGAIEERVTELERRQTQAFEALQADIARFVSDNTRRLETLESSATLEARDIAAEFDALRRRMEDRVLGVEQRSVRALEQVADTMAVLEQRFGAADRTARSA